MALLKDYDFTVEFTPNVRDEFFLEKLASRKITEVIHFPNAYHKITDIKGSKQLIEFIVGIFDNSDCTNLVGIKKYQFIPDVSEDSGNFLEQGYEFIKTLEEYTGAEDC